jgi:alpha-methylacyl-CoA racemase
MGPLRGVKVLEIAGLAPVPFCGMILSDFGADVIRIDRIPNSHSGISFSKEIMSRGKRSVCLDLKSKEGIQILLRLIERADVIIDPFRPGITEKLGFGPKEAFERNPKLVYARLTGFGQDGPYSQMAGHDINYIAISGLLSMMGRKNEPPMFPLNIIGDFAGGGLLCAMGIVMALFQAQKNGIGQVIDSAMVDGSAYLSTFVYSMLAQGLWNTERGTGMLDGGAPFYEVYGTKDGKWVSVGAIEPQFYAQLLKGLELDPSEIPGNFPENWEKLKEIFAEKFKTKTREEWSNIFNYKDACVMPVLQLEDLKDDIHLKFRGNFFEDSDGNIQPAPAPRLSSTPAFSGPRQLIEPGQHTVTVLMENGFLPKEIETMLDKGIISAMVKSSL